jgi:hypothetical protein
MTTIQCEDCGQRSLTVEVEKKCSNCFYAEKGVCTVAKCNIFGKGCWFAWCDDCDKLVYQEMNKEKKS